MLRVELILPTAGPDTGLRGSGLIAVNPPWTFA
jgi:23S rRNA A2030 N6-methylase RlmJ